MGAIRSGKRGSSAILNRYGPVLWCTAAAASSIVVYFLLDGGLPSDVSFALARLAPAPIIWFAAARRQLAPRRFWLLLAAAQAAFAVGDVVLEVTDRLPGMAPHSSLAGVLNLAGYPLLGSALLVGLRGWRAGRLREILLDAAITALGLSLLLWVLVITPTEAGSLTFAERMLEGAPALLGVLVLAILTVLMRSLRNPLNPTFLLLTSGAVMKLASDVAFLALDFGTAYQPGGLIDAGWLLFGFLWAIAALNSGVHRAFDRDPSATVEPRKLDVRSAVRLLPVLLPLIALLGPLIVASQIGGGGTSEAGILHAGAILIIVLTTIRVVGLMRTLELRSAVEAERRLMRETLDERLQTSRELHDIMSHGLAGVTLLAGGARSALAAQPPCLKTVAEALRMIEQKSSTALQEVRSILIDLREGPVHSGSDDLTRTLESLVHDAESFVTPELQIKGSLGDVPGPAASAAVRIVQEALTNALRYAPGSRVEVEVVRNGDLLDLKVENDGSARVTVAPRSGYGLIGMTERTREMGGEFSAGPRPDGGWQVTASLSLADEA